MTGNTVGGYSAPAPSAIQDPTGPAGQKGALPPSPQMPQLPRQRRKGMFLLAVLLIGAGALVGVYVVNSLTNRISVVVMAKDVPAGTELAAAHLTTAMVSVDPSVQTIPADQVSEVAGKIAQVELRRGTLLAPSQLTTALSPQAGQQVVSVALKSSQLPARGIRPGDQILVVATPGSQGQEGGASSPGALNQDVPATVDRVGEPDADGLVVVDLLVTATSGPSVAKQASTGRIALIVTARRP